MGPPPSNSTKGEKRDCIRVQGLGLGVMVTIGGKRDFIRVLLYRGESS